MEEKKTWDKSPPSPNRKIGILKFNTDVNKQKKREQGKKKWKLFLFLFFCLLFGVSSLFFTLGYCDSTSNSISLQDAKSQWKGLCKPCPSIGKCVNGSIECPREMTSSWFYGCVADNEIIEVKNSIRSQILSFLSYSGGKHECDESVQFRFTKEEIKIEIYKYHQKNEKIFEEFFDTILDQLIQETLLKKEENKIWSEEKEIPLVCYIQKSLASFARIYFVEITVCVFTVLVVVYLRHRMKKSIKMKKVADKMIEQIKEGLKDYSKTNTPIPVSYLKSEVMEKLSKDFSHNNSEIIWQQIVKGISRENRIRQEEEEVNGEIKVVWKWLAKDVLKAL